jgi:hypothetical protein
MTRSISRSTIDETLQLSAAAASASFSMSWGFKRIVIWRRVSLPSLGDTVFTSFFTDKFSDHSVNGLIAQPGGALSVPVVVAHASLCLRGIGNVCIALKQRCLPVSAGFVEHGLEMLHDFLLS